MSMETCMSHQTTPLQSSQGPETSGPKTRILANEIEDVTKREMGWMSYNIQIKHTSKRSSMYAYLRWTATFSECWLCNWIYLYPILVRILVVPSGVPSLDQRSVTVLVEWVIWRQSIQWVVPSHSSRCQDLVLMTSRERIPCQRYVCSKGRVDVSSRITDKRILPFCGITSLRLKNICIYLRHSFHFWHIGLIIEITSWLHTASVITHSTLYCMYTEIMGVFVECRIYLNILVCLNNLVQFNSFCLT